MNHTTIPWVLNPDGTQGYTLNPISGCLNGCSYCYARKLANGRLKSRYLANNILPTHSEPNHEAHHADPFYPRFWPEKLKEISPKQKLRGIFVCSMSDLFGIGVPEDWTRQVMDAIKECPQHRFYLLTKQAQNMVKYSPFPDNAWVGISATNYAMANNARYYLQQIKAKVKYLSIEPLLEPLQDKRECQFNLLGEGINWLVLGCQTKPVILPRPEWVREILAEGDKASIPVFVKPPMSTLMGIARQEFPHA